MQANVITYSIPSKNIHAATAKIHLTRPQVERLQHQNKWPRSSGEWYSDVCYGEHWGSPSYTDADIELIIADDGDVSRAREAVMIRRDQSGIKECKHTSTTRGRDRCYNYPVAVPPYTDENPPAQGSITYTETCATCGAERDVNANRGHREFGPWRPAPC